MRKRLNDEICRYMRGSPQGDRKKRRKMKASERLAQELEFCERTLLDAKHSYEQLLAFNLARRREQSASIDLQSPQLIAMARMSTDQGEQNVLPLPAPPDVVHLEYTDVKSLSQIHEAEYTVHDEKDSVSTETRGTDSQQSYDLVFPSKQKQQSHQLPSIAVSVTEASKVFTSFLHRLTEQGIHLHFAMVPRFEESIVMNDLGGATQVISERSLKVDRTWEEKDVDPPFSQSRRELPAVIPEVVLTMKNSNAMQRENPLCLVSCRNEKSPEASTEVEPVKPLFPVHGKHEEVDKEVIVDLENSSSLLTQNGDEESKEEVEMEETPILTFDTQLAEELEQAETEEPPSPRLSDEFTEEREVVKANEKQSGLDFLSFDNSRKDMSSPNVDSDDGLKSLWDDMEFSFACMNETTTKLHADKRENDGCIHDFYRKSDMGLVCSKCGLVGLDAEHIFDYVWGEMERVGSHGWCSNSIIKGVWLAAVEVMSATWDWCHISISKCVYACMLVFFLLKLSG